MKITSSILAGASALAITVASSAAMAGAFGIREQSATAQGQSYAGAASGSGGLSSMFWNPATITMSPGWQSQVSASLIVLDADITPRDGTSPLLGRTPSGDIGQAAAVPSTYSSYQLNDRVWIGLSATAPFGLVTKPDHSWAGQIYSRTSRIVSLNFNPIIGIKVTDWLSVAAGPTIEYFDVQLKRASSFLPTAPSGIVSGNDAGVGMTAGVTITPFAGTVVGVGYRSTIHHELDGTLNPGGAAAVIPIRAKVNMPDQVNVGLTQAISPNFRLNLGYEWTNWSRIGTVAFLGSAQVLPLRFQDGHFISGGAEYDVNAQWTLRAGAGYEWTPVTDQDRSTALPDANRIWASIGASYRWSEKLKVDFAYSHGFLDTGHINIVPGNAQLVRVPQLGNLPLPFVGDAQGSVDIVSASLSYRWDDVKVAQPAPIIRKY
jgi:long-chain fatty acid transport protein